MSTPEPTLLGLLRRPMTALDRHLLRVGGRITTATVGSLTFSCPILVLTYQHIRKAAVNE